MALGRLIERLFVQVRADLSHLSGELAQGVGQTRAATQQMARQWEIVSSSIENMTADLSKGLITQGQYMSQLNRHASAISKLGGSYREAQRQVHSYAASLRTVAAAAPRALSRKPVTAFTRSVGQANSQMLNLGFQINDIGQTLATGMNPFTVMIQQGSQILQIYAGQGGLRTALGDISRIFIGIGRAIWPLAAIAAGFGLITREINKTTGMSVSFMDTTKAVFQVLSQKIMGVIGGPLSWLNGKFKEILDFIGKWFPKVFNAIVGIVSASIRIIGATWDLLPQLWQDTWTTIKNIAVDVTTFIIDLFKVSIPKWASWGANKLVQALVAGFRSIRVVWEQLPEIMKDAIGGAVNFVVGGVENLVNSAVEGINKLISGLQTVMDFVGADAALEFFGFSGKLTPLDEADLSKWKVATGNSLSKTSGLIAKEVGKTFNEVFIKQIENEGFTGLDKFKGETTGAFSKLGEQIQAIVNETLGSDFAGDFFDEIRTQAIENAMRRVAAGVEDIGGSAGRAADEIQSMMEKLEAGLTTAADNLSGVFGNAFERLAETGRFTFGSFIKDMNRLIIKSTSEILQQELSNMLKRLATSKGGLGSIFSNLFSGLFGGGLSFNARGGTVMPWQDFVAGEEGPELVTQDGPSGARRVKTAGQTAAAMRGGAGSPITVNQFISTPDVESFRQSQGQLASRATMFLARGRRNQ